MTTHRLKTWPALFQDVLSGIKPFEVRKNDRDFQVGDTLVLEEWDPAYDEEVREGRTFLNVRGPTGRTCEKSVSYVLLGGQFGIVDGYCVLGFGDVFRAYLDNKI